MSESLACRMHELLEPLRRCGLRSVFRLETTVGTLEGFLSDRGVELTEFPEDCETIKVDDGPLEVTVTSDDGDTTITMSVIVVSSNL